MSRSVVELYLKKERGIYNIHVQCTRYIVDGRCHAINNLCRFGGIGIENVPEASEIDIIDCRYTRVIQKLMRRRQYHDYKRIYS